MNWLDKVDINFVVSDLFQIDVDAIVCPVKVSLEPYGNISKKLFSSASPVFHQGVSTLKQSLPSGHLLLGESAVLENKTDFYTGNYQNIIFTALWDSSSEYTYNLFQKSYSSAIRAGFELGLKSIALPVMNYDRKLPISAKALKDVITGFNELSISDSISLREVFFVSIHENDINYLIETVEPRLYR